VVEEGITSLGHDIFSGMSELREVKLPESLTRIGPGAFQMCPKLRSLTIPKNVNSIDGFFISETADGLLESGIGIDNILCLAVDPPTCGLAWGYEAFYGADTRNLKLIVPTGSARKYKKAPQWCDIKYLSDGMDDFGECGYNAYWRYETSTGTLIIYGEGETWDRGWIGKGQPWFHLREEIKTIIVGEGITRLGEMDFKSVTNVESIYLPKSLTTIEQCAFERCKKLKSITIPENCFLKQEVFFENKALESLTIKVTEPQGMLATGGADIDMDTFIVSYVLGGVDFEKTTLYAPEESVEKYKQADGWKDFKNIKSLSEARIVEGKAGNTIGYTYDKETGVLEIKGIGSIDGTFMDAWREIRWEVKHIKVNEGITEIKSLGFQLNEAESISLPTTLTHLGYGVLFGSEKIKQLTIPKNVTTIAFRALGALTALESLTNLSENPQEIKSEIMEAAFSETDVSKVVLIVPVGSVQKYANAEGWKDFYRIIDTENTEKANGNKNANLKSLKTDIVLDQIFSSITTDYYATVKSDVKTVKIDALAEDSLANIEVSDRTLKDGENTITVKVTAENKDYTKEYVIHIYRISGEARIKSLEINQGSLEPAFTPNKKEYVMRVTRKEPHIVITPTPMYEKAKVQTIEDDVSKDTTYNLVCTAEDGKAKETYKIKIEVLNDNAALKRLNVRDYELIPEFDPFRTNYNVDVPDGTREIFIEAEPQDSNAELSGHLNWNQIQGRETIFNVHVKAQDRYSECTYLIHVKYESITTAVKRPAWDCEETVMIYTVDGRYLGTTGRYDKKIITPDWLGHGIFIAKGSKYREKFTN
jgi:hypothetical protein